MERLDAINAMRRFLGWLEDNSDVPFPYSLWVWDDHLQVEKFCVTRKQLEASVKALGKASKSAIDNHFCVKGFPVDGVELTLHADREAVCKRKVVGTKHVERRVIPEQVIEAHDEEIIEWDCGSVLADDTEKAVAE